jgi:hypothetical protein
MSEERTLDLIRWTFTIDPSRKAEVVEYLGDLGLDVHVATDGQATALWDEPEDDLDTDAIIEGLWEAHGSTFEVTHEEFGRTNHMVYDAGDQESAEQAA